MIFSDQRPGRTAGSIMVIHEILAELIASHPQGEALLGRFADFARNLEESAMSPAMEEASAEFVADMAGGAQDTLDSIEHAMRLMLARDK